MQKPTLTILHYTLLFLAFFSLLTGLIETTYAFGLLQTDIPPEIGFVLFILSPLVLVLFPGLLSGRAARALAVTAGLLSLAAWALTPWLDTRAKLLVSGAGAGLWMLFLPALLRLPTAAVRPHLLGSALGLAGLLSILLHALQAGLPLSGLPARLVTGLLACLGMLLFRRFPAGTNLTPPPAAPPAGFLRLSGAWLGLLSALLLLYYGFSTPAVIARWTGASGAWVPLLAAGALALLVSLWLLAPGLLERLSPRLLLAWNLLFVLALAGALLPHQIAFPPDPATYPLAEPPVPALAWLSLLVMLLLHPVIYVDFARLAAWLEGSRPAPRALAGSLSLAALVFLLALFAHVFTTVYDYIPVAGPWFRDRFWLVTTIPALVLALAAWLAGAPPPAPDPAPARRWLPAIAVVLFALVGLLPALNPARPAPPPAQTSLRVLTYNIQQGYNAAGQPGAVEQLQLIRDQRPDLVGLQESDMARIANGSADVVGYFASELGMYAYYGPKTVTGTFGIALLSRYPIENPRTFYMYSAGEQTAALAAEIQAGARRLTVIVTHLGNGGPLIQQQQVLAWAAGHENIVLMGDFNFRPGGQQYQETVTGLVDAWPAAGEQVSELPPGSLDRRIDHVFLSPGLPVRRAHYLAEGPSDHPGLVVDIWVSGN